MSSNKLSRPVTAETLLRPLRLALIAVLAAGMLAACSSTPAAQRDAQPAGDRVAQASGSIYLYGEVHGNAKILDKEFERWSEYYQHKGMRHLFVELSYYTAAYLNIWMKSDNDEILDQVYEDWKGTAGYNPYVKAFYRRIKDECPDTVFHGTDVGHQYDTTGSRFLSYLEAHALTESEEYTLTEEAIQQGRKYYGKDDHVYRENKMADNFIREYDKLGSESVMGIYGSAHTGLNALDYSTKSVPCMANQLQRRYGGSVSSEDLSWIVKDIEPSRTDHVTLRGREYAASYFGRQDLNGFKDYAYREFWRLENAYKDVEGLPLTGNYLPSDNYPMLIGKGEVYMMVYTKTDGSAETEYHLCKGQIRDGQPATEQFRTD